MRRSELMCRLLDVCQEHDWAFQEQSESQRSLRFWNKSCRSAKNLTSTVEMFEIGFSSRILKKNRKAIPFQSLIILDFSRFFEEVSLKLCQNWTRGDPSIGNLELYFDAV